MHSSLCKNESYNLIKSSILLRSVCVQFTIIIRQSCVLMVAAVFACRIFEWQRWWIRYAITFHSISIGRTFCMRFILIVNCCRMGNEQGGIKEIQIFIDLIENFDFDWINSRFSRYVSSESRWFGRLPKILLRSARLTCVKCEFSAGKQTVVLLIWSSSLIGLESIACVPAATVWCDFSAVLFRFVKSPGIIETHKIQCTLIDSQFTSFCEWSNGKRKRKRIQ